VANGRAAFPEMIQADSIFFGIWLASGNLEMSVVKNLKVKSLDSIGQYGAIELRRVFPLSCSNDTLLDLFAETCQKNHFVITERTSGKASAIKEAHNMYVTITQLCAYFSCLGSIALSPESHHVQAHRRRILL
jgi:hypothetical protein